jgi:glutathione S-transferase
MKLIMAEASPFARKVRVLLRETNQLKDVEEVSIATSPFQVNEQAKAANPTGRIPSLIRADGPALYDSRVITRYLDAKAAAGMYPEARLWDVLTVEATGDSMMDSAVSISYELRLRPQEEGQLRMDRCPMVQSHGRLRCLAKPMDGPVERPAHYGAYQHCLCAGLSRSAPRRTQLAART